MTEKNINLGTWGYCPGCTGLQAFHLPCSSWSCSDPAAFTNEVFVWDSPNPNLIQSAQDFYQVQRLSTTKGEGDYINLQGKEGTSSVKKQQADKSFTEDGGDEDAARDLPLSQVPVYYRSDEKCVDDADHSSGYI